MSDPTQLPDPTPPHPATDPPVYPVSTPITFPDGRVLRVVQESEGARPLCYLSHGVDAPEREVVGAEAADLVQEANAL